MKHLHRLLWILAFFPWLDFIIRTNLPSVIGSIWDDIFLLLILVTLWLYKRREPRYLSVPGSVKWPFLLFLFFCLSSVVVHIVPLPVSIDAIRVIFQPVLFALITMYLLDDEETSARFMNFLLISTVLIAVFGIIQYVFKIDTGLWKHAKDTAQFRIVSIFSNPNALAAYFNMILAFTVASVLLLKDKKQKLLYLLVSLVIFVALLLTFSRSAWIAFVIMVLYFVFVWNKKWLIAIPVFLASTPFILPQGMINRFAKLFDPTYYQMSSEYGRLAFWAAALEKIKENPLLGVGLGMFGDSVALRHNIPFATWVDNHYLKLGAEIGVPGLICFMLLLFMLFRLAHRLYLTAKTDKQRIYALGVAGVIITMSIQNVTASILEALADAIYFYALTGILFAFVFKAKKEGKCSP
ncbi:MAG: O-antigen ligase family protein [Peptococcaceae bacterium]|nr:O-antigen ligase family protein [Peptococcaceae bacterium]